MGKTVWKQSVLKFLLVTLVLLKLENYIYNESILQNDKKGLAAIWETITAYYPCWTTLQVSSAVQWHGYVALKSSLRPVLLIRTFSTGQTVALRWAEQRDGVDLDQYPSLQRSRAAGHPWPGLLISRSSAANSNMLDVTQGWEQTGGWGMGECVSPVAAP